MARRARSARPGCWSASGSPCRAAARRGRARRDRQRRSAANERRRVSGRGRRRAASARTAMIRADEEEQADDRRRPRARPSARSATKLGITAGHACDPGLTDSTPTTAHSGRLEIHRTAGPMIAAAAGEPGEQPGLARRAMPQLGQRSRRGQDDERHARVVVVLERRPVDAGPRHPLARRSRHDQRQREAAPLERLHAQKIIAGMPSHQMTSCPRRRSPPTCRRRSPPGRTRPA